MNEIFLKVNQDVLVSELQQVRPDMLLVLAYFSMFCWKNRLHCVVTSVFEEVIERASDTHKEGRGVDVSVRGFGPKDISDCIDYLNENVGHLGAYSFSDNQQRVAIYHNIGFGNHIHLQVAKNPTMEVIGGKRRKK